MADENIMSLIQNLLLDDAGFGHTNGSVSQLDPLSTSSPTTSGAFLYGDSLLANLHRSSGGNVGSMHSSNANNSIVGSNLMGKSMHHSKDMMMKSLQENAKLNLSNGPQSISLCNGIKNNSNQNVPSINSFGSTYADLAPSSHQIDLESYSGSTLFGKSYAKRNSLTCQPTNHHMNNNGKQHFESLHKKSSNENGLMTKDLPLSPLSESSLNSFLGAQSNALVNQSLAALTPQNANNCLSSYASFGLNASNNFGSLQASTGPTNSLMSSWQNGNTLSMQPNSFADLLLGCGDSSSATAAAAAAAAAAVNGSSQFNANAVSGLYNNASCNLDSNSNNNNNNNEPFGTKSQSISTQSSMTSMFTQMPNSSPSPDSFVYTEEDRFEAQMRSIANEIHSTIGLHMNGLQMRREALLQQLEHIKKIYRDVLRKQKNQFNGVQKQPPIGTIGNSCNGSSPPNMNYNKGMLANKSESAAKFPLPSISFTKPDTTLYKNISSLGYLNTPAFAPFCSASGDGLEFAVPGVNCGFTIETRNCFNDELRVGRETIQVEIIALFTDPKDAASNHSSNSSNSNNLNSNNMNSSNGNQSTNGTSSANGSPCSTGSGRQKSTSLLEYTSKSVVPHTFFDHNNGKYSVTYVIPMLQHLPSELVISISVNGLAINDSPIRVQVQMHTRQNWKRVSTFGTEGNSVGELCRPWGVAVVRMPPQLLAAATSSSSSSSSASRSMQNSPSDSINNVALNETSNAASLGSIAFKNGANNASNAVGMRSSMQSINSSASSAAAAAAAAANAQQQQQSSMAHYLIGVADRSNNRIQMLDYDSKTQQIQVINVFGSGPGNRPGMFDRPAGICINLALGHIIVADKDNHRIQVFSLSGRYLFKFGEKGSRVGQFCYPWDIDCCSQTHHIVVSDTRNRRIQLFTPYGVYVTHFSMLLDSPRGVAFLPDRRLVVSDFNRHRILVFDKIGVKEGTSGSNAEMLNKNGNNASNTWNGPSSVAANQSNSNASNATDQITTLGSPKIIGFGEGTQWGEFLRPQGIAVNGNQIFCADSRNNRISVYNLLTHTFEYLNEGLDLDRPSDLAVIDDNLLVVVDFGNNRLQILQR